MHQNRSALSITRKWINLAMMILYVILIFLHFFSIFFGDVEVVEWHLYRNIVKPPLELSAPVLSGEVMLQRHMKAHGKKMKLFSHDQNPLCCTSGWWEVGGTRMDFQWLVPYFISTSMIILCQQMDRHQADNNFSDFFQIKYMCLDASIGFCSFTFA